MSQRRIVGRARAWRLAAGIGFGLLIVLRGPATATPEGPQSTPDLAALVHPLAGTQTGGVFPGADIPFGMVQFSPNTVDAGGGGYRYSHPITWGFALTHISGPGCPAMGDVVSLPTTGPVHAVDATRMKTKFSHAGEEASPGYYAVTLASAIRAELTATTRTAWARYSYPAGSQGNVVIDPGANLRGVKTAKVRIVGNDTVEGSVGSWGYWNACPARRRNRYTLYFSIRFSRPFASFGTGTDARIKRGRRWASGPDAGAYVSFDSAGPVVSKTGISFVDLGGARSNLSAEAGSGFDFDATHAAARSEWNDLLGRVRVSGGDEARRATFYTALYHSLLHPNVFSDADGRYVGFDDRVHRLPAGQAHYTDFSMWDTSHSAHQVIDLVAPERVGDMVHSLLDDQRQSGWLPKWPYAHYETNEMVGDPAANVIADALLKGLVRPEDVGVVYRAALHNATDAPGGRAALEARTGLEDYINRGYVPYDGDGDDIFAGSLSLEYAVNDCALALMAQRLGKDADARYLLRRAKRFRYSIDRRAHFARSRGLDRSWLRPFDARSWHGFKEGSAAQYTWLAPQDVSGLAHLLGGTKRTLVKLDHFFQYPRVAAAAGPVRGAWRGGRRYNPRNETDLQAPYLYDYLGQPWKTQAVVRAAEGLFTTAPNGLPGSDDLGSLSSWYVLSALGLYPVTPGDDHYALTSPLFERASIHTPSGAAIEIDAPGAPALRYVQAATLDGRPLGTSQISQSDLARGAQLEFTLGSAPNYSWAAGRGTPRSACAANPSAADVRLHVSQARSSRRAIRIRMTLRNAGDAAARRVVLRLRVPRGWRGRRTSAGISVLGHGRSSTHVWTLRPRGRRHAARIRADVRWSTASGGGGALRTFATAMARVPHRHSG